MNLIREAIRVILAAEEIKMPKILYHLTDNPDFDLNPDITPEAAVNMPELRATGPGIFLTSNPDYWVKNYQYFRPHVAEFEVSDALYGREQFEANDKWSNGHPEVFVPSRMFDQIKLRGVRPYDWKRLLTEK